MPNLQSAKRILVAVLGGTVLFVGVALIVLPGPALVVIPVGLAILAMEFAWARRWLRHAQALVRPPRPTSDRSPANGPPHTRRRPFAALARWWHRKRRPLPQSSKRRS